MPQTYWPSHQNNEHRNIFSVHRLYDNMTTYNKLSFGTVTTNHTRLKHDTTDTKCASNYQ